MERRSFGSLEYEHKKVKTRRQRFLERMEQLVPWEELEGRIAPVYPKPGRGRRPYPLPVMLRIHCLQLWFNLSDPGMEQELYDSRSMLEFAGLTLTEPIPDETTVPHFRHLLERHQLGTELFATINAHLAERGLLVREGTIVDSTIISAPTSNEEPRESSRPGDASDQEGPTVVLGDEARHRARTRGTGLVHSVHMTAANVSDVTEAHRLVNGGEVRGVGRRRLPGSGEAAGASGIGGALAGGDAIGAQASACSREPGGAGGAAQGLGAGEGGAPVPLRQAALRIRQGALPGA